MLIALSQRNNKNQYGDSVDSLENNYVNYLEGFGIKIIAIPNSSKNVSYYFKEFPINWIILTGGDHINPELYGGKMQQDLNISKEREETEKKLLEIAIENKLPVLGICRGIQFINIFFKGKLINIKEEVKDTVEHVAANHPINITDEEAIKLLGNKSEVNSYHNYGITNKSLSTELKIFAKSSDKVIEGIYHPSLPIAGIEWHPERKSPDEEFNKKIINAFLKRELFWKD